MDKMKVIIIFCVIAIITSIAATVVVGVNVFDGTIEDHPYEKGLEWDKLQKSRTELGWKCRIENNTITTGVNDLVLKLDDIDERPLDATDVSILISRPYSNAYDKRFDAEKIRTGVYKARTDFPYFGYWDIKIAVTKDSEHLTLEKSVYVSDNT
jgi:nitrogen fixation protein FixH